MGKILIIDGDSDYYDHIRQFFTGLDHQVGYASSYSALERLLESGTWDVIISDIDIPGMEIQGLLKELKAKMPDCSIIIVCENYLKIKEDLGDIASLVFRFLQKPFYDAELHFQVKRALERVRGLDREAESPEAGANIHGEFIGQSPVIDRIFRVVDKVASADVSVIILGETGTGKDLIAQILHNKSLRAEGPYVKVNCAALPEQLLESELFGYEKGAFTGADHMRVGRFEHANGGTIFLDEVADLSLVTQAKLLRVLQQKEFERLGSNITITTDVRIISATNKDLIQMIHKGQFREDLFYRLNVIAIRLPPLRERGGDISLLLMYFLKRSTTKMHKRIRGFHPDALKLLTNYRWPGNIREMENTLERAVLMAESDVILPDDLDLLFEHIFIEENGDGISLPPGGITLEEAERQLIRQALTRCGGSQKDAAKLLGVSSRVLSYKMQNLKTVSEG